MGGGGRGRGQDVTGAKGTISRPTRVKEEGDEKRSVDGG